MNKTQKKQAGDYLRLLEKAHNEVRRAVETKKYDVAMDLLEQCQDAAIELGNRIEAAEGEGFVTIPLLEDYCELTYQIHEEIWQKHFASAGKVYKNLRKSLIQIENSVKNDIKVRTEAVFLPYKASMWDSLESVWKAADEDPGCDAYVIPIPYYDKNPDGSFREMHYEGKEYPDYVPVTWYEDYDFASRQPDMIFIHNPYDNNNYVTSVHPFFYSENLKQYTEKLVYIPYFILGEVDPDNEQAVEGVAHFVTCPGVMNADKVIVQSEAMRQVYIKVLTKFAGEGTKKYWEERILGLGSPKIDKVLNTRREDLEVPEEWLKVIQKPDGSWKKIVFYNTSVSALLQNGEKMLRKMEDVFRVFKENQDEVALLWRPHPLIKATIESMRPEVWGEYRKIVEGYCSEGWGIYDDSADLERAVVMCDGYYGDPSSVAWLSEKVEKLVMIQRIKKLNCSMNTERNVFKIRVNDAIEDGRNIWFFSTNFKSIFLLDTLSKKTLCYRIPSNSTCSLNGFFSSMSLIQNKIYLIPLYERDIFCFDMDKREFKKIKINREFSEINKALFMGVANYKDYLFIMGIELPVIIRLNTRDDSIEYITQWEKNIRNLIFDRKDAYFRQQWVILDNKLFVPFCNANAVLELNCDDLDVKIHIVGKDAQGYSGISFDGKYFWLSPRKNGKLVKWNVETGAKDYFRIDENEVESEAISYAGIVCCNEEKILFPFHEERKNIGIPSQNIIVLKGEYSFCRENNNTVIFYEAEQGVLTKINKLTHETLEIPIQVEIKDIDFFVDIKEQGYFMPMEENGMGLVQFIKVIKNSINKQAWSKDSIMCGKESCGYSIFTM